MSEYLRGFVPASITSDIHFNPEIIPAVRRLADRLPADRIWNAYSTAKDPVQTGGRIVFPYFRLDTTLAVCEMSLMRIDRAKSTEKADLLYLEASQAAFETIAWVEVGFGGLEPLTHHRVAVKNTTIGEGDDAHRKAWLLVHQQQYNRAIGSFVQARTDRGIPEDDFTRYNLEYLLYKFRSPEPN